MGRGALSSSNSKVKSNGFSPVVQNSGAMYLSMVGVGRISVFDFEVIQQGLVLILPREASVGEIAVDVAPIRLSRDNSRVSALR